jgi:tetratricopeptide (TPR) repeat protein
LAAARRALEADDADLALDRARAAVSTTADERAVVEYDAAQALRVRARKDAAAKQLSSTPVGGGGGPIPGGPIPGAPPPSPPQLDEAIASFERAAGLAVDRRLQSEARLAAGNAALEAGKIDEAIAALRKALVADPQNDRARRNLQRALEARAAKRPPPPQNSGDNEDKDQEKRDQQQDQQQQDQQKQDQQKQDQQQQDQQKQDQQKQDQQQQDQQQQDQQKQDQQKQDQQKQDQQKQDQQKQDSPATGAEPKPAPKKTTKDEKRRLLQGLRSRERPLTPLEMRGVEPKRAREGKDW